MAIKVNGTTVVDDSRNLTNVASIDATTEAAISAAGFSQTTGDITNVSTGGGLTGGGSSGSVTVSHADTSSQGSVNNSGSTVIQDITLDTYGHITGINSTTISSSPPTSFGAVGTYAAMMVGGYDQYDPGATLSGSLFYNVQAQNNTNNFMTGQSGYNTAPQSGTWRAMSRVKSFGNYNGILVVRIS